MREFILLPILVLTLCYTQCSNAKVVALKFDQKAPYDGYLFDPYTMKIATQESLELIEYKKLNELNKKIIDEQNSKIANNAYWNTLYFIGGAFVGGLAVKAIAK